MNDILGAYILNRVLLNPSENAKRFSLALQVSFVAVQVVTFNVRGNVGKNYVYAVKTHLIKTRSSYTDVRVTILIKTNIL